MRLTLRTLLAYLDDTLEPAKAKEIGQKVAESDAARELVERIKQVTRRRRITVPPASGAGSNLDPNTIAEYLDNTIAPEEAAEVEAICLAKDVHLAEVAACHQILTLVLGEPMSVPPTAKQRMYGLVKGPEAIPFRKPAAAPKEKEPEAVTTGRDIDDTLRLGLPPVGTKSSTASKALLFGGGFAAACLLAVAIWQVLNLANRPADDGGNGTKDIVKLDDKDKKDADKKDGPPDKDKTDKGKEKVVDKKEKDDKEKEKVPDKKDPKLEDVGIKPPDAAVVQVGQYLTDEPKDSNICLQEAEKGDWRRLTSKRGEVLSAKPLLSLPGSWSTIALSKGVRLTLCGNVQEIGGHLPVFESKVVLHNHDKLDLDMTLVRGQVILTGTKDRPAQVRIRFANPFDLEKPEHYDLLLHGKTEVVVGLTTGFMPGEAFFPNPKDKARRGPVSQVVLWIVKGDANVKYGDVTHNRGPVTRFSWHSMYGPGGPFDDGKETIFNLREPPPAAKLDDKTKAQNAALAKAMKEALANLAYRLDIHSVRVKLEESLQTTEPTRPIDPKSLSLSKLMLARLTVRSIGALGDPTDMSSLLELLDPPKNDLVREAARDVLIDWLSAERDNDYVLYDLLKEKYNKLLAERIMRLLHGLSPKELSMPETYEELIDSLNNSNPIIRELTHFRLVRAVPYFYVPYSAWATSDLREAAVAAWRAFIPPGSLPPAPKKKPGP